MNAVASDFRPEVLEAACEWTARDVVRHHRHGALLLRHHGLPLLVVAAIHKGDDLAIDLLEALRQRLCSFRHAAPPR